MALQPMFPAQNDSPKTTLAAALTAEATTITLVSTSGLPAGPGLLVIGTDDGTEVIKYTGISGNVLIGCSRGFGGTTAKAWPVGTIAARNFTAYDHDAFMANITDLDTNKAPLASPTLTGTPKAPTAEKGTNTTQLATTAFVAAALADKQDTLTFDDTPTASSPNPVKSGGIKATLDLKAPLVSPTLTGTPKAPTAAKGTNTTQLATTAFVAAALEDKQNTLTFDDTPTASSPNPVKSGGIKSALDDKAVVITKTVSGDIVTIDDAADAPVADMVVNIEPNQDLNGYDLPWVGGAGKNLFKPVSGTARNITFTIQDDGTVKASGTSQSSSDVYISLYSEKMPISNFGLSAGDSVTLSCPTNNCMLSTKIFDANDVQLQQITVSGTTFEKTGIIAESAFYLQFIQQVGAGTYPNGSVINETMKFQFEKGTTVTEWTPYENICPISGWTGCNVTRTGKNFLPNKRYVTSTRVVLGQEENYSSAHKIFLKPGTYTIHVTWESSEYISSIYYASSEFTSKRLSQTDTGTVIITKADYYAFWVYNGNGVNSEKIISFQLELGSTATSYEPYNGNTYSVSFGSAGAVYGGSLDVTTGVLTVNRVMKTEDGTADWSMKSGSTGIFLLNSFFTNGAVAKNNTNPMISNLYAYGGYSSSPSGDKKFFNQINDVYSRLWLVDSSYTTVTELKEALATNPLTVVYYLAEPQIYQLTPTEVTILLGRNNIFADTGGISVTYRADTKTYIDNAAAERQRSTQAMITSNIEATTTASKTYAAGNLIILNGQLLRATTGIGIGGTIEIGSNAEVITLETILAELSA